MKVERIIWLPEIEEKLWAKHGLSFVEVEDVLFGKPFIKFVEHGHRPMKIYMPLLAEAKTAVI